MICMFCEKEFVLVFNDGDIIMKNFIHLFISLSLSACSFKSPLHSKMQGTYEFTFPTPYLLVSFERIGSSHMPDYPYFVFESDTDRNYASFAKPQLTEISDKMHVKVGYYYRYAIDSGTECPKES